MKTKEIFLPLKKKKKKLRRRERQNIKAKSLLFLRIRFVPSSVWTTKTVYCMSLINTEKAKNTNRCTFSFTGIKQIVSTDGAANNRYTRLFLLKITRFLKKKKKFPKVSLLLSCYPYKNLGISLNVTTESAKTTEKKIVGIWHINKIPGRCIYI